MLLSKLRFGMMMFTDYVCRFFVRTQYFYQRCNIKVDLRYFQCQVVNLYQEASFLTFYHFTTEVEPCVPQYVLRYFPHIYGLKSKFAFKIV